MYKVINWVNKYINKLESNYGTIKTGLLLGVFCSLVAIFFYSPYFYYIYRNGLSGGRGADFFSMKKHLFNATLDEPILYYRFLLPSIAHYLKLSDFVSVCIPYITGSLSLSFLYIGLRKKLVPIISFLITLGISLTFHTSGHRFVGFSDNVCHMFSALLLFTKNPILVILYSTLGLMNDERFIFSIPFILLWHFPSLTLKQNFKSILLFWLPVVFSLCIYIAIRLSITKAYGLKIPDLYSQISHRLFVEHLPWERSWLVFFVNTFLGFRFFWFFIIFYLLKSRAVIQKTSLLSFFFFSFIFLIGILSLLSIADISRSVGYLYTGLIVSMVLYKELTTDAQLTRVLAFLIFSMIITPVFQIHNTGTAISITFTYPLVVDLFRLISGI